MRCVAVVVAPAGDTVVSRVCSQRVGGRTLTERSIGHAQSCAGVEAVYAVTDDPDVAARSKAAGAQVLIGPLPAVDPERVAVDRVVAALRDRGEAPGAVMVLSPRVPFRPTGTLDAAWDQFQSSPCDCLVSAKTFDGRAWQRGSAPDHALEPRPLWLAHPSLALVRVPSLGDRTTLVGGVVDVIECSEVETLVIRTDLDLEFARLLYLRRRDELRFEVGSLTWLVLDVDGTLTDGTVTYAEDGGELRRFDTRDATGLRLWQEGGGKIALVAESDSKAIARRAQALSVDHVITGAWDKGDALDRLCTRFELEPSQLVVMGDDVGDMAMAEGVGLFAAPADAHPDVLARAQFVTHERGGRGAVRELVEILLACRR